MQRSHARHRISDMGNQLDRKTLIKTIRERLTDVYGGRLRGVILYGSEATGDSGPHSDVDVLVLLDHVTDYGRDLRRNIDALYPLAIELDRRISAKPVEKRAFETVDCPLFREAHVSEGAARDARDCAKRILDAIRPLYEDHEAGE